MSINASEQEIAAARAYEDLHVPALFKQFSPLVVAAAGVQPGQRVLDVACGTGVLAREAAAVVGERGLVAGLDPTLGMLAVARQLAPAVEWKLGTAESLPFEDGAFDAVASQFGLMFFSDPHSAVTEMLRVLVPGGRMAVAVWDSLGNLQAYPEEVELLERLAGTRAADALRAPFVLGDTARLRGLFADAGVAGVEVVTHAGTARFPNIRTMVEADLRGWLPVMGVELDEATIASILEAAEQTLARYVTADGTVEFETPAHIVSGHKL